MCTLRVSQARYVPNNSRIPVTEIKYELGYIVIGLISLDHIATHAINQHISFILFLSMPLFLSKLFDLRLPLVVTEKKVFKLSENSGSAL